MNGFGNAPISKAALIGTFAASLLSQTKKVVPLPLLVFRTPGELIAGCFLIYIFRVLERQSGSAKFGGFVFISTGLSAALQLGLSKVASLGALSARQGPFAAASTGLLVCGPYGLLFASLVQFYFQIPPSRKFNLLGWRLSDKIFVYFAASHLLICSGTASVLAAATGVVSGLLYRSNFWGLKKFRFPSFINQLFSGTLGLLLDDSRTAGPTTAAQGGDTHAAARAGQAQASTGSAGVLRGAGVVHGAPRPMGGGPSGAGRPLPAASPEAVEQMVAMGFDRERAAQALRVTSPPNDVDQAISILVS